MFDAADNRQRDTGLNHGIKTVPSVFIVRTLAWTMQSHLHLECWITDTGFRPTNSSLPAPLYCETITCWKTKNKTIVHEISRKIREEEKEKVRLDWWRRRKSGSPRNEAFRFWSADMPTDRVHNSRRIGSPWCTVDNSTDQDRRCLAG